jgi:hypothetical protein
MASIMINQNNRSYIELSVNEASLILGFRQYLDNSDIEITPRTYRQWSQLCDELAEFIEKFAHKDDSSV